MSAHLTATVAQDTNDEGDFSHPGETEKTTACEEQIATQCVASWNRLRMWRLHLHLADRRLAGPALRDVNALLARGVLRKSGAGGRSTSDELNEFH